MSARSRALEDLARHFRALRDGAAGELDRHAPPLYNAWEMWDQAADMASRTAEDVTWRARMRRVVRWRHRRLDRFRRSLSLTLRVGSGDWEEEVPVQVAPRPSVPGIRVGDIDWDRVTDVMRRVALCWQHFPALPVQMDSNGAERTTCLHCGRELICSGNWWVAVPLGHDRTKEI